MTHPFQISLRPFDEKDKKMLDRWRTEFADKADLKLPHGYRDHGVITNIAVSSDKRAIASLTGVQSLVLDPFIQSQMAGKAELLQALFVLTRSLEIDSQYVGAKASFICIPNDLADYQDLVKKTGFEEIGEDCKFYKHTYPQVSDEKKD